MIYGDNQTKHFYVVDSANDVVITNVTDNLFRIQFKNGDEIEEVSDVIDNRRILNIRTGVPAYPKTKKWEITVPEAVEGKYRIYFYIENLFGFGMQDRWDRVISYDSSVNDSEEDIAKGLADAFNLMFNNVDYKHMMLNGEFEASASGAVVTITQKAQEVTKKDIYLRNYANNYNVIVSAVYEKLDSNGHYGDTCLFDEDVKIYPAIEEDVSDATNAMTVLDMEHYFLRNRGDIYDLTKDFNISILNEIRTDEKKHYATVDVHYAFSDGLGFTYYSEKDITIAVAGASKAAALGAASVIYNKITGENCAYISVAPSQDVTTTTTNTETNTEPNP